MRAPQRSLKLNQKLLDCAYNVGYRINGLFEEYKQDQVGSQGAIYLLGRCFDGPNQVSEAFQHFRRIIWITYRTNFPELCKKAWRAEVVSKVSDTGWGCMIRTGQMLFAEVFRHHCQPATSEQMQKILEMFNDFSDTASLSIQRISDCALLTNSISPGDWYNPAQISFIIKDILTVDDRGNEHLAKLSILVNNSSSLFMDEVLQYMKPEKIKDCYCLKSKVVCSECNRATKSIMIIILCRIGLQKPEPNYLECLNSLMGLKYFKGVIGGKPKRAHYFVGRSADKYIYLDPHVVHEASQANSNPEAVYCQSFRMCDNFKIDPSFGISFYVRDLNELNDFYDQMSLLQQKFRDFFIYLDLESPSYIKDIRRGKEAQRQRQRERTNDLKFL